ncbi:cell division ATP-binding protein FtsE [Schleiferilactobacillus harbinensis]|uniref:cell division ATP-binding protein FtsE n=1 Tax=Schleiferilactobacillus harbinensis TaxID=304207 RepID=UPI0021A6E0B3|nr:cell division ATP-binding protein FtsE [Schleiferilactobacillus harbinensis]MCT2907901.1 cell division ATP-binding protein FtsE [Schleiferilactobacillus harbinensis]
MIRMVDVSKVYDNKVTALENVNVEIAQGDFVYVVGPSGAGKSTFIKLLYRELRATSGLIMIDDFDLTQLKDREVPFLRRKIGVVFQDFKLLSRLTVAENIAYAMEVIETDPEEIKQRVTQVLAEVGLTGKAARFPNELSGGEQQRVAIARAIANKPHILIADEPTGNLDPNTSEEIMALLEKINAKGTTVIMATHNDQLVNSHVHRLLEINNGDIVRDEKEGTYANEG